MKTVFKVFLFIIIIYPFPDLYTQDHTGSFEYEGKTRTYEVYLPQDFQPNMPVVLALHGYSETIKWFKDYTLFHEYADTSGFILVYPEGSIASNGQPGWNTGLRGHPLGRQDTTAKDVGFISALIDTIAANYDIDLSRIYCCGFSMGGEMTYRLAIELGDHFAAIASVAGKLNDISGNLGEPIRSFPVLHFHGTRDNIELYEKGLGNLWSTEETVNFWTESNDCSPFYQTINLPDINTNDNCTVEKTIHKDDSNNPSVIFYKIINGGHSWPSSTFTFGVEGNKNKDINTNAEIWNFFKNYENPLVNNYIEDSWTPKADIPTPRCWASSCELDGKIHVIGGISTSGWHASSIGTMEVYDPATDTWDTTKAPMPTSRSEFCACVVNGKIYAIGGVPSYQQMPMGTVEVYDPLTDSWDVNKTPMPTPRTSQACGVINNKIYIAGGTAFSSLRPSNTLDIYDPATDTWSNGADMSIARYHPSSAVYNDTLYIIGGLNLNPPYEGYKTVQKYDPATNSWSIGTELLSKRVGLTTSTMNGKIYAIGGESAYVPVYSVEEYDPTSSSWSIVDSIPVGRFLPTASVFDGEIYVFGGSNSPPPNPTNAVYSYKPKAPTSGEYDKKITPTDFVLYQNYPNPFNPSTTIKYQLPANVKGETAKVRLVVYDILGREVATLVNKQQKPGFYEIKWDAINQPSGVYFYQLRVGQAFAETKKMLLLR